MTSSTTLRVFENGALKTAMPLLGGGVKVYLIGADAERPDGDQTLGLVEDGVGDPGPGPDAEDVDLRNPIGQLVLAQCTPPGGHLEPRFLQTFGPAGMDVLEEEGAPAGGRSSGMTTMLPPAPNPPSWQGGVL